ncbi:MAG: glycoside hydrolase [Gammaproteobacteria bacterium]|nr:glycoside hydrolase [Gammaproteobacteria bacterium]
MTAPSKSDWRLFLCLVILGLIGTWVPLFDLDEGAFLEATRELLADGHWAATTLDGEPRYDKPILSYWLQASSLTLFGWLSPVIPIEMIGRLPSVIAGALWATVLGRFSAEVTKKPSLGVFVTLALATTLGTSIISRAATADAVLNLWLALLFTDIARYIRKPSSSLRLKVFLWLGLGILTKGPVAIIIPACAFGLWVLLSNQWALFWNAIKSWGAWALLVALLTPWLIGVYDAQGHVFFERFILRHNVERFYGNLHGHGGHPLYYLLVTPLVLLPYCGLVIAILIRIREYWACPVNRFALVWVAVVLLLVSSSGTQLPHYVLYSTAPLFVLYARVLPTITSRLWALPGLFVPISALGFGLFHDLLPEPSHLRDQEQLIALIQLMTEWRIPLTAAILSLLLLSLTALMIPKWHLSQRLITLGGVQLVCIAIIILPLVSEARQQPLKEAALIAKEAKADVVSQGVRMPSFSFYRGAITKERVPIEGQWVLISVTLFHELEAINTAFEIKASGPGWRLIAPREPSKT